MANWQSLSQLSTDVVVFDRLMHALLGLYGWEVMLTLDFDWAVISGKRKFRWPLVFYFAGRYLLLFAMIGILISLDTPTQVNCQALYVFNQLAGDSALGLASINLSLRTIAIWSPNKWVIGAIVLLILGHWSLILQGVLLKAVWVKGIGCTIVKSNTTILAATFIYSMSFDLVVLCLTAYKLAWTRRVSGASGIHSKLIRMVFSDGLVYFLLAFLANLVATIFMILDLNAVMGVIFNVPAAMASTIVASRVVRRLYTFNLVSPEVFHSDERSAGGVVFGNPPLSRARPAREPTTVHVEVDTHRQTHSLSDVPQYAMKPSSEFLSLNDADEHAKVTHVF